MIFFDDLKSIKRKNKEEYRFVLLLCLVWGKVAFDFFMVFVGKILQIPDDVRLTFYPICVCILSLSALGYFRSKVKGIDIIFYAVLMLSYFLGFVMFPENEKVQLEYLPLFSAAVLYYFLGISSSATTLRQPIFYVSLINFVCLLFYFFFFTKQSGYSGTAVDFEEENMEYAYYSLPSLLYLVGYSLERLHFSSFCKVREWPYLLMVVLSLLYISSMGTRGPLMCIIIYIVLYVFFLKDMKYKTAMRIFSVGIGAIALSFLNEILLFMAVLTESLGMSSRIFQLALESTFFGGEASGDERLSYNAQMKSEIFSNNAPFGHGYLGSFNVIGNYPHNLYYDLLFTFGAYIGTLMVAALAYLIYKSFMILKDQHSKSFLLLLVMIGVVKLMMSDTFVREPFFFFLIGYCMNVIRNKKIYTIE